MTPQFNLSALVTCHTLYFLLTSLQSAVFLLNSRQGLFVATIFSSGSKSLHLLWHPFFQSYGANLPSSLTWFLSRTLGFSPRLPVSVLVRLPYFQRLEAFLVSVVSVNPLRP